MMNSASFRVLIFGLLVFLGGFVRAELTAPSHRFFGVHTADLPNSRTQQCASLDSPALVSSTPVLETSMFQLISTAAENFAAARTVVAPEVFVAPSDVVAESKILPEATAPSVESVRWLAALGSLEQPVVVCDTFIADEEAFEIGFGPATSFAAAELAP